MLHQKFPYQCISVTPESYDLILGIGNYWIAQLSETLPIQMQLKRCNAIHANKSHSRYRENELEYCFAVSVVCLQAEHQAWS